MRSIFAFVLGIAVTVGAAYVHDNFSSEATAKQLVNWPRVADTARTAAVAAREQWDRLTAR